MCVIRVTWTEGAHNSHHFNSPREVQVFGYDSLILVDAFACAYLNFRLQVCKTGNHNLVLCELSSASLSE